MKLHALLAVGLLAAACSSSSGSVTGSDAGSGSSSGSKSGSGSGSASGSGSGSGSSSGAASDSGSGSGSSSDSGSGDTWASWAQGFFSNYCVECHSASDTTGRDFTKLSIVVTNKDTIRCGVCVMQDPSWNCGSFPPAKQFPISDSAGTNPKPTDAERDRAVAWIDAGCP